MVARRLALVVVRGSDIGVQLVLDERVRIVGRARGADLPLTDLAVSRRHLEVSAAGANVTLKAAEGAAPFLREGQELRAAQLVLGESVVLGNTVLRVAEASVGMHSTHAEHEVTSARTLLGGLAVEVRGLAAVYELTEALDAAADRTAAAETTAAWTRAQAGASGAQVLAGDEARGRPELAAAFAQAPAMVERKSAEGIELAVAVAGAEPVALVAQFQKPTVGDDTRRLLAVAARVAASSMARLRRVESADQDRAALRRLAIGGATSFLGSSEEAARIAALVPKLAASDAVVLLLGESGTGKTFLARLIHEAGPRATAPLRVVNCAAIPETLLEAELFGHERGAFTGAVQARAGAFEGAGRGTILLDEVGELSTTSQAKLLRVLEDRVFERIGSNKPIPLACRVLAATNCDLEQMVESGSFRRDLYFRLSVVAVRLPPLSERGDDVVVLAMQLLGDLAPAAGRRIEGFTEDALSAIRRYGWPGNVRELRNALEHALVLGEGSRIAREDLPPTVRGMAEPAEATEGTMVRLPANLDWLEARAIEAAMAATGGNRTRAAALLGINRVTLYKKLRG